MKSLLSQTELRRYKFIETLAYKESWETLDSFAEQLNCSTRVLSKDIAYFRKNFDSFKFETSKEGVRVRLKPNEGILSIARQFISQSPKYNLIETIFFSNNLTVNELTDLTFLSAATIYRFIREINNVLAEVNMKIETNPCRIVGDEARIRLFFYRYFNEKYDFLSYPFAEHIDEEALDAVLAFFVEITQIQSDFAFYNIFKSVSSVNIIRYRQGFHITPEQANSNFKEFVPDISIYTEELEPYEWRLGLKVNEEFVEQVWFSYTDKNFSVNYEHLIEKSKHDINIAKAVNYLEDGISSLISKYDLTLTNREGLILCMRNRIYLKDKEGLSGYNFFDRNEAFALSIKLDFPEFYHDVMSFIKGYIEIVGKPYSANLQHYLFYFFYVTWDDLLTQLRKEIYKIKAVVSSDRHFAHAKMLKSVLESELGELVEIEIFQGRRSNITDHYGEDYDIYISDFPTFSNYHRHVYVESVPFAQDIQKLQGIISEIYDERRQERTGNYKE